MADGGLGAMLQVNATAPGTRFIMKEELHPWRLPRKFGMAAIVPTKEDRELVLKVVMESYQGSK